MSQIEENQATSKLLAHIDKELKRILLTDLEAFKEKNAQFISSNNQAAAQQAA